jgi:hypothetical protein
MADRALELDRAAEHLRQPPADREPEPRPAVAAVRRAIELSYDAPIVTEPRGVNFSALLSRFSTTCFTFWRSLLSGGSLPRIRVVTVRFERLMIGSSSDMTSFSRSGMRNVERLSGILPASIRVMSRMSLISASRCREFESIRVRLLRCGSDTDPVTPFRSMWV